MLYDEFLAGTGCRDTAKNYKVFRDLEILYMNSEEITKEEIYEYGKKLVDNSLTKAQVAWNARVDGEIAEFKDRLETAKANLARYEENRDYAIKEYSYDTYFIDFWKQAVKEEKQTIKNLRGAIRNLKATKYV